MIAKFRKIAVTAFFMIGPFVTAASSEVLFESKRITPVGEYAGIEGPAVDKGGNLYAVNYLKKGTIGRVLLSENKSTLFATLPVGSVGNGIRIGAAGTFYVADYRRHNIFAIKASQKISKLYFHSDLFNQPNDLAIRRDGTLYASDPLFRRASGRIWRVSRRPDGTGEGAVMKSARSMGTTNGLDFSPDEKTLYVSESNTREIWAYRLDGDQLLTAKLILRFPDGELDGLRTDVDGRIYVARPGAGKISIVQPDGTLVREIKLTGNNPTNLTFGGADRKTVYVTQSAGNYFEAFRVDRPGREPFE